MKKFILHSPFTPKGDQRKAIEQLSEGVIKGNKYQILLGVTGSGKTFTIANVIERVQKPVLVISHNKTLAAQLYQEFRRFFPENAVEYFVSYYDYYQPEAYIPATDTYIAKEAFINDEIDRMRLSATRSLYERRDVIVVASVSAIYGIGSPETYFSMFLPLHVGKKMNRKELIQRLVESQYERSEAELKRGFFRVRGDMIEIFPTYEDFAYRIELFGDEIDGLYMIDNLTGKILERLERLAIYPKTYFVTPRPLLERALQAIEEELEERLEYFRSQGKFLEAQRLEERTRFDIEMIREFGYCHGIENYSRHLSGRREGEPPFTIIDYFPVDSLFVIDESHQTIPQLRGMYEGDRSRKLTLVEHGFRLPSALDNRPLKFEEFKERIPQVIFVSATPGPYELEKVRGEVVEQIIRPTGLTDPLVEVRKTKGQMEDLIGELKKVAQRRERALVTTLTKRMAERLTEFLAEKGIRVRYLHSDIETLERIKILKDLRKGVFDVLVGINLLREGLDLPEVSLVAILDADKEGFLRSSTSLIQTFGRAARNVNGKVVLYADNITDSMRIAIDETERRRKIQEEWNRKHGIVPKTIKKEIEEFFVYERDYVDLTRISEDREKYLSETDRKELIEKLEREMKSAVEKLEFERAAMIRDELKKIKMYHLEIMEG
ncbi:MAG: excinuclease ABC subunit UvrB [Candidatus Aminicenantia bacterium]